MDSIEHFIKYYDCFGSDGQLMFSKIGNSKVLKRAFLYPVMEDLLKSVVPGKKILDIGCGAGIWCCQAALLGAESVHGFDIQEDIVQIAKKATSKLGTVSITVGDVENMPYCNNEFDVAISLYVTCNLPKEKLTKHFKELSRVLIPGGKAFVLSLSQSAYDTLYLSTGVSKTATEEKINVVLAKLPLHPTKVQVIKALEGFNNKILRACFAVDKIGRIYHVTDVSQLSNGQAIWNKKHFAVFPDYYYSDHYLKYQIVENGLIIDKIENIYTEERRNAYNTANANFQISETFVTNPCALMYHLTKPITTCSKSCL